MFRIFCESYDNYISQYKDVAFQNEYRFKIAQPLKLLKDLDEYEIARKDNTLEYKQISDLLFFMEQQIERFPKLKAFLWTLESRDIKGHYFGVVYEKDLMEQVKLVNMFLSLLYWDNHNCH
ncbi:hypothetical protein [Petroclostridium sp. X23]|uniref:hypothetical protein n=1 Tax=Petroclostridium sp. X23 TaxID=3045146 RepID=UPI0024AD547A|nr:hypothetical protein [Petroclostridium sp. X23]WHH59245.1 hypothetical protein QKW49_00300 [Petroclostridium sp. X23]